MICCFQRDDDEEVTINPKHSTPCRHLSESEISQSTPYTPRFEDMSPSFQTVPDDDTVPESPQDLLNKFLIAKDVSPIKHSLTIPLRERTVEEANSDVHATLSIKHPILYDVYNLCELTAQNEMGRFSKQMLKEMCSAFDLDPSQISDKRRKQPYIDLLTDLVHSCSCFETS